MRCGNQHTCTRAGVSVDIPARGCLRQRGTCRTCRPSANRERARGRSRNSPAPRHWSVGLPAVPWSTLCNKDDDNDDDDHGDDGDDDDDDDDEKGNDGD